MDEEYTISFDTLHDIIANAKEIDENITVESFTCINCSQWRICGFSFDIYNLYGDCLMEK